MNTKTKPKPKRKTRVSARSASAPSANGKHGAPKKLSCDDAGRYNWDEIGEPGVFMQIDKSTLCVDHEYQRDKVSMNKVAQIANGFSWTAFGVVLAFEREDGSLWVYDGQHRVLAASRRGDITTVPVLVFKRKSGVGFKQDEAKGFVVVNTCRKPMARYDRHRAARVANDAIALAIDELVESCGYEIGTYTSAGKVAFIEAIDSAFRADKNGCEETMLMCAALADGGEIHGKMFRSLFALHRHLRVNYGGEGLETPAIRKRLMAIGYDELLESIKRSEVYHNGHGAKIGAAGLVDALNHGRRAASRIPRVYRG